MASRDNSTMSTNNSTTSSAKNLAANADRSARSVFVGNISYEVGEEQLRQVFSKVGPVVHLRLVHDRETGKPKGYGFCEFHDAQTAESAIRNLNGYELKGRSLRVDSAVGGERNTDETSISQAFAVSNLTEQAVESPYGVACSPELAPEMISRAVASIPPEQMFELITQMKQCVINNPNETKNLLASNAQLAYALLQTLVVMKLVDPHMALSMLQQGAPGVVQSLHLQSSHTVFPGSSTAFAMPQFSARTGLLTDASFSAAPSTIASRNSQLKTADVPLNRHSEPEVSSEDHQQAQLLMQVLQLSEDQIALLPPDDRRKVTELRNQLRSV